MVRMLFVLKPYSSRLKQLTRASFHRARYLETLPHNPSQFNLGGITGGFFGIGPV
jgi:hypothetical protein